MTSVQERRAVRSLVVVLGSGEQVIDAMTALAVSQRITGASFDGIGVFSRASVGYLDPSSGEYVRFDLDEPVEVLSFAGTITTQNGAPVVHAHVALGLSDTGVRGGHLLAATVHPTLEVTVSVYDTGIERAVDLATGQDLIVPTPSAPVPD